MRLFTVSVIVMCFMSGSMGPRTTYAKPDSLESSIAKLARHVFGAKQGVALGVRVRDAIAAAKGGITVVHEGYAPLGVSGLPGSKGLTGVVRFSGEFEGDEALDSAVDSLTLEIVVPSYDRASMTKHLKELMAEFGAVTYDDDEPHVHFGDRELGDEITRSLWFGLGERVIVLEGSEDGREAPIGRAGKK